MIEKMKKNLPLVALLLGLVAFAMIFCSAMNLQLEEVIGDEYLFGINGYQVVFGWELLDEELLEFSFMALLSYLLPLAGVICTCLAEAKNNQLYHKAAIVCFLAGVICLLCMPVFSNFVNSGAKEEIEDYLSLGAGAVIAAICCAVSSVSLFFHIKKKGLENPNAPQVFE